MFLRIYRAEFILLVLFSAFHSLIFHLPQFFWVGAFSVVPLFICLELATNRREAFFLGYLGGILLTAFTYYWLVNVAITAFILACLYLGLFVGLFSFLGYSSVQILSRTGKPFRWAWIKIVNLGCLWVLVEYIRSSVPIMRFPWALFGYSQWKNITLIQFADHLGAYGVSLLLVIVNASLYALWVLLRRRYQKDLSWAGFFGQAIAVVLLGSSVVGGAWFYGHQYLAKAHAPERTENLASYRIAVIQGNIPQEEKWDERIKNMIYQKYEGLTRQAVIDLPDLIVWPETSFPGYWEHEPEMVERLKGLARELRTPLFVGAPTLRETDQGVERMNSAIFISSQGVELNRYHKLRLVPFGEYVPFFQVVRKVFNTIAYFSPGEEMTVFEFDENLKFSALICFEDIFPDLCRLFVNQGSRLLINITNDAWFNHSSAPYQHAQSSVFRAIENRVPVVRAANTGLSCFIRSTGEITASVKDQGEEIFVTGFKTEEVFLDHEPTFYSAWGDRIPLIILVLWLLSDRPYVRSLPRPPVRDYSD